MRYDSIGYIVLRCANGDANVPLLKPVHCKNFSSWRGTNSPKNLKLYKDI